MTIHPLKLGISNAFLIKDKSNILVDTGSKSQLKKLIALLAKQNCAVHDIHYIIITHAHWDHCGNAASLKKINLNIKVIIHQDDATCITTGENAIIRPFGWLAKIVKPFFNLSYNSFKADMVFNDVLPLNHLGLDGYVLHTPGHTSGSCSVIFNNNNKAIVGDLIMAAPCFKNRASYHLFVDNYEQNNVSIRNIISRGVENFYVGHGSMLHVNDVFLQIGKKCIYH